MSAPNRKRKRRSIDRSFRSSPRSTIAPLSSSSRTLRSKKSKRRRRSVSASSLLRRPSASRSLLHSEKGKRGSLSLIGYVMRRTLLLSRRTEKRGKEKQPRDPSDWLRMLRRRPIMKLRCEIQR